MAKSDEGGVVANSDEGGVVVNVTAFTRGNFVVSARKKLHSDFFHDRAIPHFANGLFVEITNNLLARPVMSTNEHLARSEDGHLDEGIGTTTDEPLHKVLLHSLTKGF